MSRQGRTGASANPRAQADLRKSEKLADSQRKADIKSVMAMPEGRRFLADLIMRRCGVDGDGFSPSGSQVYFLCGQRSVGVALREELKLADVKLYTAMLVEAITESAERRMELEGAAKTRDPDEDDEDNQNA